MRGRLGWWPHRFVVLRGTSTCGRCGIPWQHHRRELRCLFGLHDDGTDVFGGSVSTCLRCGRPV